MYLRGERNAALAPRAGGLDHRYQQSSSDAAPSPRLEHGHPADVAVGKQASSADRFSILDGERVEALGIEFIHLDLPRHALLVHENGKPDRARLRLGMLPAHQLNLQHRAKV